MARSTIRRIAASSSSGVFLSSGNIIQHIWSACRMDWSTCPGPNIANILDGESGSPESLDKSKYAMVCPKSDGVQIEHAPAYRRGHSVSIPISCVVGLVELLALKDRKNRCEPALRPTCPADGLAGDVSSPPPFGRSCIMATNLLFTESLSPSSLVA